MRDLYVIHYMRDLYVMYIIWEIYMWCIWYERFICDVLYMIIWEIFMSQLLPNCSGFLTCNVWRVSLILGVVFETNYYVFFPLWKSKSYTMLIFPGSWITLSHWRINYKLIGHCESSVWINHIQGGPEKNGMAYFPQYVDAITVISVWGNSPDKNDTKISNFGTVVCFLGETHFVRQCRDPKLSVCHNSEQ